MIKAVQSFDPKTAAGLLARAALSVGYINNPLIESESELFAKVVEEARNQLGFGVDDNDPETIERIADFLDSESDKLLQPPNTESAIKRLAERGELPSDLYEINIIPNVQEVYGKRFPLEKEIIETAIRAPTLEQHYGPPRDPHEPSMISLFVRSFRTTWPLKDFSVVVAGQRRGLILDVHQAWRVYPQKVNLQGAKTPVDWLRKFADSYGAEIEVQGKKGHFFLIAEGPIPNSFSFRPPESRKERLYVISRFAQTDSSSGIEKSALILAIDADKYRGTLDELGVRRESILDRFVPAPHPSN
jgi:hypothetical protein